MSINRVTISGNLTRDPEVRTTGSGTSVMSLGVAVNDRRRNNQTGEWEDYANFIDCTMFGARAERLAAFLHKGAKVCIDGRLRWSQWERDGQKRSKLEVIVDDLEMMQRRDDSRPAAPAYQQAPAQVAYAQPVAEAQVSVYDEDIPF